MFDEEYWNKIEREEKAKFFLKLAYKLRKVPRTRNLIFILLFSFVAFMWMYVFVFIANDDLLKELGAPLLFEFEFAFTYDQANLIISAWNAQGMLSWNILLNILDFPFIFSYVLILMSLSVFAMRQLKDKFLNIGLKLIYLPILAGLLDVIQNIFILIMLLNANALNITFPLIVSLLAIIKYALMFGTIGFLILAIIVKILYYYQIIQEGK
ncbi:MAG: hypothetical protein ACFFBP_12215 [Promethearchaeota archaeon]